MKMTNACRCRMGALTLVACGTATVSAQEFSPTISYWFTI